MKPMKPLIGRQYKELGAMASDPDEAMKSLVRLLATRERSVQEAHNRLLQKGYSLESSSSAIERALACGLLDDQRFAVDLIKNRLSTGWGRHRIDQELYHFGIAKDTIEGYPEAFFTEEEQLEQALIALKRHRSRSKKPQQAAYRHLVARGFSSDIAAAAIKTLERKD